MILACQLSDGGLRDKITKPQDIYHTCYSLSGLSISQTKSNFSGLFSPEPIIDLSKYSGEPVFKVEENKEIEEIDTKDSIENILLGEIE